MTSPAVSVVVPARDSAATIGRTLAALGDQRGVAYEVIVVDDGSTDATAAIAEAHSVVAQVIRTAPMGSGPARNAGVAAAAAPVIAFTDADCEPLPDWLAEGLAALAAGADLVQGRVDPERPPALWDRTVQVHRLSHLYETANLFVDKELFERIGGFQPWFESRLTKGRGIAEDVWLGWRARRAGARIAFAEQAAVRHAVFDGTPFALVKERTRLRFFPEIARRIPELRRTFFYRRVFLSRRTFLFDLAVVGLVVRRPLLALPYARELRKASGGNPKIAVVSIAADATGLAALVFGSLRTRTPLL